MQEDQSQTVSFQPIGYEGPLPWYVKVFVIYLLCVLLTTIVRTVALLWKLRKLQKMQERGGYLQSEIQSFWEISYSRIRSIKSFSHLTFLLAVIVLGWDATDILAGISMEKVSNSSFVAARFAEALVAFLMGVILSCVLFVCAMFLENRVRRGRLRLGGKAAELPPLVE